MALCGLCGKFTMQFPALQTEKGLQAEGVLELGREEEKAPYLRNTLEF